MNWNKQFDGTASPRCASRTPKLLVAAFLLLLVATSLPALAGTVNMKFTGVSGGHSYAGAYTYPYDLKVNGGLNQWMMCISYNEHISVGETWKATVVNVGTLDPSTNLRDYEAAFLFKMAVADHGSDPNINAAAWWLLEGAPSLNAPAQGLELLAQSQTYSRGEYSDVLLYTPIAGSESGTLGTPQAFLGSTPEPGTLALFGSGVIGLGGLLRRRLRG
jgi:PEP-CTERM motif